MIDVPNKERDWKKSSLIRLLIITGKLFFLFRLFFWRVCPGTSLAFGRAGKMQPIYDVTDHPNLFVTYLSIAVAGVDTFCDPSIDRHSLPLPIACAIYRLPSPSSVALFVEHFTEPFVANSKWIWGYPSTAKAVNNELLNGASNDSQCVNGNESRFSSISSHSAPIYKCYHLLYCFAAGAHLGIFLLSTTGIPLSSSRRFSVNRVKLACEKPF